MRYQIQKILGEWEELLIPPLDPENFRKVVDADSKKVKQRYIGLGTPGSREAKEKKVREIKEEHKNLLNQATLKLAEASLQYPGSPHNLHYAEMLNSLVTHYVQAPPMFLHRMPYAATPEEISLISLRYPLPEKLSNDLFEQWCIHGTEQLPLRSRQLALYLNHTEMIKKHGPEKTIYWQGRTLTTFKGAQTSRKGVRLATHYACQLPWLDDPEIDPEWIFPLPGTGAASTLQLETQDTSRRPAPVKSEERLAAILTQKKKQLEAYIAAEIEEKKTPTNSTSRFLRNLPPTPYENIFSWASKKRLSPPETMLGLQTTASADTQHPLHEEAMIHISQGI